MATDARLMTADELSRLRDDGWHTELVAGVVLWTLLGGMEHGRIAANLILLTHEAARRRELIGHSRTGYWLAHNPDTVLALDISFLHRQRSPEMDDQSEYPAIAPDWGIEVIAPTDPYSNVSEKIDLFLAAGIGLLWIVDPRRQTVTVFSPTTSAIIMTTNDVLDGGEVLPGWTLPVRDIFSD